MSLPLTERLRRAYGGKTVLVTGHTGFKGSWLSLWLGRAGARVLGYALSPPTDPNLFTLARVATGIEDCRGDILDRDCLSAAIGRARPDYVFHLAAQPLVRVSYEDPIRTFAVNVMGTAHVLEAVRACGHSCTVVAVTSDKCYENRESLQGYREDDPLGGYDPYSASKGCAELVTATWRRSFPGDGRMRLATARAGNVIGGGDWARDRILTDCICSLCRGEPVPVRNPAACRPWQHVLEPVGGYLLLAAALAAAPDAALGEAWNFGPAAEDSRTVRELVEALLGAWGAGTWQDRGDPRAPHEAHRLVLDCAKAARRLGWVPVWRFPETVARTAAWYRAWHEGRTDLRALCLQQIEAYERGAEAAGLGAALP